MIASSVFYQKKKPKFSAKLSLVALMDIFTILVFFLLLNSGESEKVESAKFVNLPNSMSGTSPHDELTILIGEDEIWLEDTMMAKVEEVLSAPDISLEPLGEALIEHTKKLGKLSGFEKQNGLAITIMGDKTVSYSLLKSVITICHEQNYRNISLAVNQIVGHNHPAVIIADDAPAAGGPPPLAGASGVGG